MGPANGWLEPDAGDRATHDRGDRAFVRERSARGPHTQKHATAGALQTIAMEIDGQGLADVRWQGKPIVSKGLLSPNDDLASASRCPRALGRPLRRLEGPSAREGEVPLDRGGPWRSSGRIPAKYAHPRRGRSLSEWWPAANPESWAPLHSNRQPAHQCQRETGTWLATP